MKILTTPTSHTILIEHVYDDDDIMIAVSKSKQEKALDCPHHPQHSQHCLFYYGADFKIHFENWERGNIGIIFNNS